MNKLGDILRRVKLLYELLRGSEYALSGTVRGEPTHLEWDELRDMVLFIEQYEADGTHLRARLAALEAALHSAGEWIVGVGGDLIEPGWEGSRDDVLRRISNALGESTDDAAGC